VKNGLKVKVRAFGDLKKSLGNESIIDLKSGARISDLLSRLSVITRTFRKGHIGSHKVGSDLLITVNGKNMHVLGESTSLKDGDVVDLVPLVWGG
jgi:molybdopterin converting factor small subunit